MPRSSPVCTSARHGPVLYRAIDYAALVDAYELYLALVPASTKRLLPINLAWAVATDLRAARRASLTATAAR